VKLNQHLIFEAAQDSVIAAGIFFNEVILEKQQVIFVFITPSSYSGCLFIHFPIFDELAPFSTITCSA
jgi:hypothetical protein